MTRLIAPLLLLVVIATVPVAGESSKPKKNHGATSGTVATDTQVTVVFGSREIQIVRHHYATRFSSLPPGLQKKVARGGALPPGWQKKIEPFPAGLERELSPLPAGYSRGVIDAHAVIYNGRGVIIDVAALF